MAIEKLNCDLTKPTCALAALKAKVNEMVPAVNSGGGSGGGLNAYCIDLEFNTPEGVTDVLLATLPNLPADSVCILGMTILFAEADENSSAALQVIALDENENELGIYVDATNLPVFGSLIFNVLFSFTGPENGGPCKIGISPVGASVSDCIIQLPKLTIFTKEVLEL